MADSGSRIGLQPDTSGVACDPDERIQSIITEQGETILKKNTISCRHKSLSKFSWYTISYLLILTAYSNSFNVHTLRPSVLSPVISFKFAKDEVGKGQPANYSSTFKYSLCISAQSRVHTFQITDRTLTNNLHTFTERDG